MAKYRCDCRSILDHGNWLHLHSLEYQLPQRLSRWLPELLGPANRQFQILDGGCGTGLCTAALKPWASGLTGVDISSAMLAKASAKNLYDQLHEAELTDFVKHRPTAFDLAVYADTLCYFGDLQEILQATFAALRSGGIALFTLEASSSASKADFTLHPTGRYSHAECYVAKTMTDCGYSQLVIRHDSTRKEVGTPVPGLMVSALKP